MPAQATDPEARWGKDSREQWVYGYKLLLDLDTGEVLALSVTPAHRHDGPVGLALVRGMAPLEGGKPSLLLADSAYDTEGLFQAAVASRREHQEEKGLLLLSGHNRRRGKPRGKRLLPEGNTEGKSNLRRLQRRVYRRLYRRRWELETVVGLLKGPLGLGHARRAYLEASVRRVRGLKAVARKVIAVVTAFDQRPYFCTFFPRSDVNHSRLTSPSDLPRVGKQGARVYAGYAGGASFESTDFFT